MDLQSIKTVGLSRKSPLGALLRLSGGNDGTGVQINSRHEPSADLVGNSLRIKVNLEIPTHHRQTGVHLTKPLVPEAEVIRLFPAGGLEFCRGIPQPEHGCKVVHHGQGPVPVPAGKNILPGLTMERLGAESWVAKGKRSPGFFIPPDLHPALLKNNGPLPAVPRCDGGELHPRRTRGNRVGRGG